MQSKYQGVHRDPEAEEDAEADEEGPAAAEGGDPVGQPLAEGPLLLELGVHVLGQELVLAEALEHLVLEGADLPLLRSPGGSEHASLGIWPDRDGR